MKRYTGKKYQAVVIGVSAGGLNALKTILSDISKKFLLPIIIVQHMKESGDYFIQSLNQVCRLTVKQADEKEEIVPGHVYLAPPDYHLMVEDDRTFSLSVDPPVNYARPAIDVLFETAVDVYSDKLMGVILTGASSDGSIGLKKIKESGGLTIVQDPATAEADFMPRSAIDLAGNVDHILPLKKIGKFINRFG